MIYAVNSKRTLSEKTGGIPRLFVTFKSPVAESQVGTKVWKGIQGFILYIMIKCLGLNITFYLNVKI